MVVLDVRNLKRSFDNGATFAVKDVSFSVNQGEILGLVGINGAGKTTTVKMCATLLAPTAGSITVAGIDAVAKPQQARSHIGLVLGVEKGFYPRATVNANMRFFADLAGVSYRKQQQEISRVLELVGLADKLSVKAAALSHGQKQRLHIARALLGNPQVLLFDEPTSGLDPDIALKVRDVIRKAADQGAGMVLTSHSMSEISQLSDRIAVVNNGEISIVGKEKDIFDFAHVDQVLGFSFVPQYDSELEDIKTALRPYGRTVIKPHGGMWRVTHYVPVGVSIPGLTDLVKDREYTLRSAVLEDAFLALAANGNE